MASGYPVQQTWQGQPSPSRASGQAIASLVLAILWIFGVGSVAAVILGHLDRNRSKRTGQRPSGVGLAGLIIGYVGLAAQILIFALVAVGGVAVEHDVVTLPPVRVNTQNPLDAPDHGASVAEANLRRVAAAEESYVFNHGKYTSLSSDLVGEGYRAAAGSGSGFLAVGVDGNKEYCEVATPNFPTGMWFLYDYAQGGPQELVYRTSAEAKAACSDHAIKTFDPIS